MFSEAKMKLFTVYPEIPQMDQSELLEIALMRGDNLSAKGKILRSKIDAEIDRINDLKI